MSMEEKKEKVIHTRIPHSLDEEIREQASRLGVSVSNLVRNVLENAVGLVGDIVADSANLAKTVTGEGADEESSPERAGEVLGWQEAVLQINAVCESCNAILPRGSKAAIAIQQGGATKMFRCLECLKEVGRDE
jgi:hypothetical protein